MATITIDNVLATACALAEGNAVTITGTASTRSAERPFAFEDVNPDPRKGRDALAIAILIDTLDRRRADTVAAIVDAKAPALSMDEAMEHADTYAEAKEAVTETRRLRADVKRDALSEYDETDEGSVRIALRDRYAAFKRATFAVPGSHVQTNLSSLLAGTTARKVASAFGRTTLKG